MLEPILRLSAPRVRVWTGWATKHSRRPWLMVSLSDGIDAHFRKAWFDPAVVLSIVRGPAKGSVRPMPLLGTVLASTRALLWMWAVSAGLSSWFDL